MIASKMKIKKKEGKLKINFIAIKARRIARTKKSILQLIYTYIWIKK